MKKVALNYLITETEKIEELSQGCRQVTCGLPEDSFLSWNSGIIGGERKKPAGIAFVGGCGHIGGRPGWVVQPSGRPQESSWVG